LSHVPLRYSFGSTSCVRSLHPKCQRK
jgi:hypothetical protein